MLCYKVFQKSGSYLLSFPYSLQIHGTDSPMHSDLMYSYYSVPSLQDLRPELLRGQFLRKALSSLSQVLPLQIHLFRQIHFLYGQQRCLLQPFLFRHLLPEDTLEFRTEVFL